MKNSEKIILSIVVLVVAFFLVVMGLTVLGPDVGDSSRSTAGVSGKTNSGTREPASFTSNNTTATGHAGTSHNGTAVTTNRKTPEDVESKEPATCDPNLGTITGHVTDSEGRPIADVRVRLTHPKKISTGKGYAMTGPDGLFTILNIPPSSFVSLEAEKDGYCLGVRAHIPVSSGAISGGVDFEMAKGGGLYVTVKDSKGTPIAGATVNVISNKGYGHGRGSRSGARSNFYEQTDLSGNVHINSLPAGAYNVSLSHSAFLKDPNPIIVNIEEGGQKRLDLTLTRGARIAGRLVDGEGNPVPSVRLSLRSKVSRGFRHGGWSSSTTGPDGTFCKEGIPEGEYTLTASRTGYVTYSENLSLSAGEVVNNMEIVLSQGNIIAGRVSDPSGTAIPGARIQVAGTKFASSATTDKEGKFKVAGLPDSGSYSVSVWVSGYEGGSLKKDIAPGSVDVDFTLSKSSSISGNLSGPVGLTYYTVTSYSKDPDSEGGPGYGYPKSFQYKDDGAFVMSGVQPGKYWLVAGHYGYESGPAVEVEVESGGHVTGIQLELGPKKAKPGR